MGLECLLIKCARMFLASIFILKYEKRQHIDQNVNLCFEVKKLHCIYKSRTPQNKGISKLRITSISRAKQTWPLCSLKGPLRP